MKDRFLKQARREYGPGERVFALVLLAPVFLFLLPCIFVVFGARLDACLEWPPILSPPSNVMVGSLLVLLGWSLAVWSMYGLFTIGRGTPVPLMATQQLVVVPGIPDGLWHAPRRPARGRPTCSTMNVLANRCA